MLKRPMVGIRKRNFEGFTESHRNRKFHKLQLRGDGGAFLVLYFLRGISGPMLVSKWCRSCVCGGVTVDGRYVHLV